MAEDDARNTAAGAGSNEEQPQQQVQLSKIYLKDVSFEAPNTPQVFRGEWRPEINVELGTSVQRIDDTAWDVALTVTVTARNAEETAYVCEVKQAGVFRIQGFDEATLRRLIGAYCPSQLFPFAREAISELVSKGGFPQMLLAPVNFEALHAQEVQRRQQQATQEEDGAAAPDGESAGDGEERPTQH